MAQEAPGGKSVTELENLHGVLNNPKMAGRALFYFRSASYAKLKGGDYLTQTHKPISLTCWTESMIT